MKQFLIGTSLGGASITHQAWKYLVTNHLTVNHEDMGAFDIYESMWDTYAKKYEGYYDNTKDELEIPTYDLTEIRNILLKMIADLHYDYTELDKLNNGVTLRIVEIPDDGAEYKIGSGEYGSEFVEQVHRFYTSTPDWYVRAKYLIKTFTKDINEESLTYDVITNDGIRYAIDGDYGIAEATDDHDRQFYFLLHKVHYYKETLEHPKVCYEILNEDNTANWYGGNTDYYSKYEMEAFSKLWAKLKQ